MNYTDKINNFRRVALVGMATSIYSEDSVTATELSLRTAKKARECMETIKELCDVLDAMCLELNLSYTEEEKALELTIDKRLEKLREEATACYTTPFNEDAMTALELAGCTASNVNECIRVINSFVDILQGIWDKLGISYDETEKTLIIGE